MAPPRTDDKAFQVQALEGLYHLYQVSSLSGSKRIMVATRRSARSARQPAPRAMPQSPYRSRTHARHNG